MQARSPQWWVFPNLQLMFWFALAGSACVGICLWCHNRWNWQAISTLVHHLQRGLQEARDVHPVTARICPAEKHTCSDYSTCIPPLAPPSNFEVMFCASMHSLHSLHTIDHWLDQLCCITPLSVNVALALLQFSIQWAAICVAATIVHTKTGFLFLHEAMISMVSWCPISTDFSADRELLCQIVHLHVLFCGDQSCSEVGGQAAQWPPLFDPWGSHRILAGFRGVQDADTLTRGGGKCTCLQWRSQSRGQSGEKKWSMWNCPLCWNLLVWTEHTVGHARADGTLMMELSSQPIIDFAVIITWDSIRVHGYVLCNDVHEVQLYLAAIYIVIWWRQALLFCFGRFCRFNAFESAILSCLAIAITDIKNWLIAEWCADAWCRLLYIFTGVLSQMTVTAIQHLVSCHRPRQHCIQHFGLSAERVHFFCMLLSCYTCNLSSKYSTSCNAVH